jgi:Tfp pilus assembly protein PilO
MDSAKTVLTTWLPRLAIVFAIFVLYDYFMVFEKDPSSPLVMKRDERAKAQAMNETLRKKTEEAKKFYESLQKSREELRAAAQKLNEMKVVLTDRLDVPEFMKMVVTEGRRIGLTIQSLKPVTTSQKEYYVEHPFEMKFRGVYLQLLLFVKRMSNLQGIVRIDDIDVKPVGSQAAQYVELSGTLILKTYRYLGSKADEIGSKEMGKTPKAAGDPGTAENPNSSERKQ